MSCTVRGVNNVSESPLGAEASRASASSEGGVAAVGLGSGPGGGGSTSPLPAVPRTYVDYAASAPLRSSARIAMMNALTVVGNPASTHGSGRKAKAALEDARDAVAAALGALPGEVVFTSGGSEADSIAVIGGLTARRPERSKILFGATEHVAVSSIATRIPGASAVPVGREGLIDQAALTEALDDQTALLSVQTVNNETGVVQPIAELGELARTAGAWTHTDAVQAAGHVPFDFSALPIELASVSAHKLGGPVGVGALLVRRGLTLPPYGLGGKQEGAVRSGTQTLALAAGFAAAITDAVAERDAEVVRLTRLRARLIDAVLGTIDRAWVNGGDSRGAASPHIVNFTFDGTRADDVLLLLDQAGIDASTGSACHAGVHQPSEVLIAMGRSIEQAGASIRFSFGSGTSSNEIDQLISVLPDVVSRARAAINS